VCAYAQVSQYTFAMCSYRERKADPTEIQQLDGFTVDYCEQSLMEGLLDISHESFILCCDYSSFLRVSIGQIPHFTLNSRAKVAASDLVFNVLRLQRQV